MFFEDALDNVADITSAPFSISLLSRVVCMRFIPAILSSDFY